MDASIQLLGHYVSDEKHPKVEMEIEAKLEIHNNGGVPMKATREKTKRNTAKSSSGKLRTIMGVSALLCFLNWHPWAKALNLNFA